MKRSTSTTAEDFDITIDRDQESTTLRLRGRLGIDSSPALRDQLLAILNSQLSKAVSVDLTDVSYIDTSGVATLIEALKIARNRQTKLCVTGLHGRVDRLFQAAGLTHLFQADCKGSSPEPKVN